MIGNSDIKRIIPIAIFVYLLATISGLFDPLIVNAAKYAQVSREIIGNNDWINLRIAGDAYEQKPPLLFWLGAFAYKIFGISPYAFKLSVILVSFAGLYGTYKLGELLYGKKTGLLAVMFLATSLGHIHFHNDIHTDTLLTDLVILSIWQLAVFFEKKKKLNFVLGLIFTGMAMLTKGPVGLAIPVFAIGTHLLLKRKIKEIFHLRWLLAIPIIGIIILPALWGLFKQFGTEGIIFYFWTNNAGRITGSYHGHGNDLLFSLHTSAYLLAPWTLFAFTGLVMQIRENIRNRADEKNEFYTLGGIIPFMLIVSVSKTQMPHYLLSILPLFMILASRWTIHLFEKKQKRIITFIRGVNILLVIIILFIIAIFGFSFYPETRIIIWGIIILLIFSILYTFFKLKEFQQNIIFPMLATATICFYLYTSILPNMSRYHSPLHAAKLFNKESKEGQRLHAFASPSRYWSLFYNSKSPGYYILDVTNFKKRDIHTGDWIFTDKKGMEKIDSIQVPFKIKKTFIHRSITSQSIKFLNPKTRSQRLQERYLIQIEK